MDMAQLEEPAGDQGVPRHARKPATYGNDQSNIM
jgi:hypothetical protein